MRGRITKVPQEEPEEKEEEKVKERKKMRLMPSTVRPKFLGDFLDGNMTGRARERERKKSEKIRKKETYTMRKREEILGKKRQDKYPHCACCTKSTVHSVNTTESFLFTYAPIITSQPKRESPSTSLSSLFISDNAHGDCCCCLNYTEPFYSSFDSYCLCNNITRSLLLAVNEPRGQPLIIGSAQYILTFPIKFHLRFVCFSP